MFLFSEDLKAFQDVLRKMLARELPPAVLKSFLQDGDNDSIRNSRLVHTELLRSLWLRLGEFGAFSSGVPEAVDGLGLGLPAMHIVLLEGARALVPLPIFETIALGIVPLLHLAPGAGRDDLLKKAASGALGISSPAGLFFPSLREKLPAIVPLQTPDGVSTHAVSGHAEFVPSAEDVSVLLLSAPAASSGLAIYVLEMTAENKGRVRFERIPTLDLVRPYYTLSFKNASCRLLGMLSQDAVSRVGKQIAFLTVSELLACAEQALALAKSHIGTRKQFGRPIGSFQAVQHKLADMLLKTEEAAALAEVAAACAESDPAQFSFVSSALKAFASECLPEVVEASIQAHGGMGFTYEYELHLYLRRARMLAASASDKSTSYVQVAETFLSRS